MSERDLESICVRVGGLRITIEQGGDYEAPTNPGRGSFVVRAASGDSSRSQLDPLLGKLRPPKRSVNRFALLLCSSLLQIPPQSFQRCNLGVWNP